MQHHDIMMHVPDDIMKKKKTVDLSYLAKSPVDKIAFSTLAAARHGSLRKSVDDNSFGHPGTRLP
jgi:hypothetical protein